MARYFLEIAYQGTAYNGLATQPTGITIQDTIENVLAVLYKKKIDTTTSSRTDAGVHAKQNYLHFDADFLPDALVYKLNAILPQDISVQTCRHVAADAHSRFNAGSRLYSYQITQNKSPFLTDTAWFCAFNIDLNLLHETAKIIKSQTEFISFCKKHSDNYTTLCSISQSAWIKTDENLLVYEVQANRFLRGMVRGLVASQIMVAKGKMSLQDFSDIFTSKNCQNAYFDAPAKGLFLEKVAFPESIFVK